MFAIELRRVAMFAVEVTLCHVLVFVADLRRANIQASFHDLRGSAARRGSR